MKNLYILSILTALTLPLDAGNQVSSTASDTDSSLSDTRSSFLATSMRSSKRVYLSSDREDQVAKRKAKLKKGTVADTCETRKENAIEEREQLRQNGVSETAPEWRKINRQITFLNGRCPGFRTTAQLLTSICERRTAALMSKLRDLKSAGISTSDEEFISTEQELATARQRCEANR